MASEQPFDQYKIDAIKTASPDRLVLMLWEAARRSGQQCQAALVEERWADAVTHGRKLQEVMADLADNINAAHPHAATMKDLYLFCWRTAISAQLERRPELLDDVETVLNRLIAGLTSYLEAPQKAAPQSETVTELSINFSG